MSKFVNKILLEGEALNYLSQEVELHSSGNRKDYTTWLHSQAKEIKIVSYKTLDIADLIDKSLKTINPQLKGCFTTAYKTTLKIPGVEYVEGRGNYNGIPFIEHGWNIYKGQHFDLTAEILFKGKMFRDQIAIIQLDKSTMNELANDLGFMGPFTQAYYYKHVLKQWDEKTIERLQTIL
ncbi:MAG: hypothetical protein ABIP51_15970 [Bacteroidia bacterium]